MKKSQGMFEGKNGIQTSAPVRTMRYPNGNQGFSANKLGGDTVPGPGKGAPLSSSKPQEVTTRKVLPDGGNPYNDYQQDSAGVLGAEVVRQNAGRYGDSPVPHSAQMPNANIKSKAGQVANSPAPESLPSDGVLGRG